MANLCFSGDIVISNSVVQYKYGRRYPEMLKRKDTLPDSLPRPNAEIRSFIHRMRTVQDRRRLAERTKLFLDDMLRTDDFADWTRPPLTTDTLFNSRYRHKHQKPGVCEICDNWKDDRDEVCNVALKAYCADIGCDIKHPGTHERLERAVERPIVHFGTVASADEVMKSGIDRDSIAAKELAIAFEMEGAGVWDNIPTVVIKSVCDYADSHKDKDWQQYASAVAACCMKAFLEEWFTTDNFTDTFAEITEVAQSVTEIEPSWYDDITHRHRTSKVQSYNEEEQKEHEEELREALRVREAELASMKDALEMAQQRQVEQETMVKELYERNQTLDRHLIATQKELQKTRNRLERTQNELIEQQSKSNRGNFAKWVGGGK